MIPNVKSPGKILRRDPDADKRVFEVEGWFGGGGGGSAI